MLDWNKVKQDKELLKRVEALVESVCDTFYDFPQDVCDELNKLTDNNWEGEQYINYCAEYWSSRTLEETVWALFHDGDLPDLNEFEIKIQSVPEELSRDEIFKWFSDYFHTDWESECWDKYNKKNMSMRYNGEQEYGFKQTIGIYLDKKRGFISAHNLSEENKEAIRKYFSEDKRYKVL